MVAVLARVAVADALVDREHAASTCREHPRALDELFAITGCLGGGPVALAMLRTAVSRLASVIEYVTVVACENHDPRGISGFVQQQSQERHIRGAPGRGELIVLGEVVVDRVDDRGDDPPVPRELRAQLGRQPPVGVLQRALVEQQRSATARARRDQAGMSRERLRLVRCSALDERAGEQARARQPVTLGSADSTSVRVDSPGGRNSIHPRATMSSISSHATR